MNEISTAQLALLTFFGIIGVSLVVTLLALWLFGDGS